MTTQKNLLPDIPEKRFRSSNISFFPGSNFWRMVAGLEAKGTDHNAAMLEVYRVTGSNWCPDLACGSLLQVTTFKPYSFECPTCKQFFI